MAEKGCCDQQPVLHERLSLLSPFTFPASRYGRYEEERTTATVGGKRWGLESHRMQLLSDFSSCVTCTTPNINEAQILLHEISQSEEFPAMMGLSGCLVYSRSLTRA